MPPVECLGQHPFRQIRVMLPDGRRMLGVEYGAPDGRPPILYFHGFTGSRLEPRAAVPDDCHLIAFDRPGYGGSMPAPDLSLRRFGHDMATVVDALGLERVSVLGISAGGPYALAAAAMLGSRVHRMALIAAVANKRAIRLEGGIVTLFRVFRRHGRVMLRLAPRVLRQIRRHGLDRTLVSVLLRGERALLAPEIDRPKLIRAMAASWRESTRPGLGGALADMEILTRRWDVAPSEVQAPCLVLHGGLDRVVPPPHSHWYAKRLPQAELQLLPNAGHLSVAVNEAPRIAAWLTATP